MPPRNRPKSNSRSRLIGNGGRPQGAATGSAPAGNALALLGAWSPALRRLFAPGTRAAAQVVAGRFGGPAADVDELVGPFGRLSRDAGVAAAQAAPVAGLGTCAAIRSRSGIAGSGPDVDVLPPAGAGARVGRRVEVRSAAEWAMSFTPSLPGGQIAAG